VEDVDSAEGENEGKSACGCLAACAVTQRRITLVSYPDGASDPEI